MTYFSNYPLTTYTLQKKTVLVRDILKRSRFFTEAKNISDLYSTHIVQDGERPEHIAYNVYNNASLHWVVLLFNEIHDPYFEWPMSQLALQNYIDLTIPDLKNEVYYYIKDSVVVGEFRQVDFDNLPLTWTPPTPVLDAVPVTFSNHLTLENDSRSQITLLKPELLSEFLNQFKRSLQQ